MGEIKGSSSEERAILKFQFWTIYFQDHGSTRSRDHGLKILFLN